MRERPSVLNKASKPSSVGMLFCEIVGSTPCMCGHRLVHPGQRENWYWQTHSIEVCTLELPDLTCWCGLRRSEHVDGHDRSRTSPNPGGSDE